VQIRWMDRKRAYPIVSMCSSIVLIGSLFMLGLYIISAMLGGIGSVYGIAAFGSLAGMTAVTKRMYKRIYMNDKIPLYEYVILISCSSIYIGICAGYPLNIVLITLSLVSCVCSYIARRRA